MKYTRGQRLAIVIILITTMIAALSLYIRPIEKKTEERSAAQDLLSLNKGIVLTPEDAVQEFLYAFYNIDHSNEFEVEHKRATAEKLSHKDLYAIIKETYAVNESSYEIVSYQYYKTEEIIGYLEDAATTIYRISYSVKVSFGGTTESIDNVYADVIHTDAGFKLLGFNH